MHPPHRLRRAVLRGAARRGIALSFGALAVLAPGSGRGQPQGDAVLSELAGKARQHALLLVGELHGTREVPALVAALARLLSNADHGLVLALELPADEQPRITAWLRSDGGTAARRRLLDSPFWRSGSPDGRSSEAMLELLDAVRTLVHAGRRIEVVCFDGPLPVGAEGDRDAALAHHLRMAHARTAPAPMLVLTGNFHARLARGAPWNPEMAFAAYLLRDLDPYNVDVRAVRGSAWLCLQDGACGPHQFDHSGKGPAPGLVEHAPMDAHGYRATLVFPGFTASPPAAGAVPDGDTGGEQAARLR